MSEDYTSLLVDQELSGICTELFSENAVISEQWNAFGKLCMPVGYRKQGNIIFETPLSNATLSNEESQNNKVEVVSDITSLDDVKISGEEPVWLIETRGKLHEVARLPRNWDGYGSSPLLKQLKLNAEKFLQYLEFENIPVPYVSPISGGGVQIEWHHMRRELEIEFMEPKLIGYLQVFENGDMDEGSFSSDNFDKFRRLVDWLTSGRY